MRSVRCDACGAKALMAASQCPKCGHLFEVRDGFGELLPLSYCSSCESYYPAHLGSCKWCGTTPEPAPKSPLIWKGAAIGGLIAAAWLAGFFMLREPRHKVTPRARTAQSRPKTSTPSDSVITVGEWVPVDTAPSTDPVMGGGGSAMVVPVVATSEVPVVTAPDVVVPQGASTRTVPRATAEAVPFDNSYSGLPAGTPSVSSSKSRSMSRWVPSVARSWTIVRSDAREDSRIVASVGPASRVMLGESQGSWRRIRSRDIVGWVDLRRSSFAALRGSARANGLASR
jgi:hypothetical protein